MRIKRLKVRGTFSENRGYVPWIRVVGYWLNDYGFKEGDEVLLVAQDNEIIITHSKLEEES
jgi:hypothetical protein